PPPPPPPGGFLVGPDGDPPTKPELRYEVRLGAVEPLLDRHNLVGDGAGFSDLGVGPPTFDYVVDQRCPACHPRMLQKRTRRLLRRASRRTVCSATTNAISEWHSSRKLDKCQRVVSFTTKPLGTGDDMAHGLERKAAQTRVKRSTLSPPPEFVGDPIVWAAWLYYEERMTQEEVADRLGVSRASVVNFLQEARDRGVVTRAVAPQHLQTVRASRELAKRVGLTRC